MKTSLKEINWLPLVHWLPRIICILAIAFISLFAGDAFEHGDTIWEKLGGFLIHLIPSFILTIVLLIAWKWEFIGGIIFIVIGLGFSPYIFLHGERELFWSLVAVTFINLPFVVVGILFLLSHRMKKKNLSMA